MGAPSCRSNFREAQAQPLRDLAPSTLSSSGGFQLASVAPPRPSCRAGLPFSKARTSFWRLPLAPAKRWPPSSSPWTGCFRLALSAELGQHTYVLYVSPLKALGNDVQKNLLQPLDELYALAAAEGLCPQGIRVQVRTGDTTGVRTAFIAEA